MGFSLQFRKYHGFGNDYLIFDPNRSEVTLPPEQMQLVCNRNFGLGSDGILVGPLLSEAGMRVKIYNPDGSEAEKSGNGLLIFAKYLRDAGYISSDTAQILTSCGTIRVQYCDDLAGTMQLDMGRASFWSNEIPVRGPRREVVDEAMQLGGSTYWVTCLTVGNPHLVIPVTTATPELARRLGRSVETAPQFPRRINLCLMQVLDRSHVALEIYERGAGYTLSSGSACCAAAAAGLRLGMTERRISVRMPGGTMEVRIDSDGAIRMSGSVHAVCEMTLSPEFVQEMLSL
jgi:diaminopimelate epimerase